MITFTLCTTGLGFPSSSRIPQASSSRCHAGFEGSHGHTLREEEEDEGKGKEEEGKGEEKEGGEEGRGRSKKEGGEGTSVRLEQKLVFLFLISFT